MEGVARSLSKLKALGGGVEARGPQKIKEEGLCGGRWATAVLGSVVAANTTILHGALYALRYHQLDSSAPI